MEYKGRGRNYNNRGRSRGGRDGGRGKNTQGGCCEDGNQEDNQYYDPTFCDGEYHPDNKLIKSSYIDTHCHLEYIFTKRKVNNMADFLRRHRMPHNFEGCISIFCDPAAFSFMGQWEELLKHDKVWGAFGCHPHNAKYFNEFMLEKILICNTHPKAVAWGEMGLDYHVNNSEKDVQKNVFAIQLQNAIILKKPIIVHSREAEEDTFEILSSNVPADWPIHIHCFNDSKKQAEKYIKHFSKLYFGLTGVITYSSAVELKATVKEAIPLERILLETDAPYMTPKPYKAVCHSGFIPLIAKQIAELKGVDLEQVYKVTRENTRVVYNI